VVPVRYDRIANVFNLEGGIAKWSDEIDSDVPKY